MATPKTIQIFLPTGDPRGIRIADITTRIVQVIEVPRSLLAQFLTMPESAQVAVYFLIGASEDGADETVYVGQTGDLRGRLATHNKAKDKDFWDRAMVLISRTHSLTQTHALFLEWYCLQMIRSAGRYQDENGNAGSRPFTPAPLEADCLEIFETGNALLSTLGYPLFDAVGKAASASEADEIFVCNASGAKGRGLYTSEGFVVLKGSRGRREMVPSLVDTPAGNHRLSLIESGVLQEDGDMLVFTADHLFRTPSGAAIALLGRTANGWLEWRTEKGQTLDELKRQEVGA